MEPQEIKDLLFHYGYLTQEFGLYSRESLDFLRSQTDEKLIKLADMYRQHMVMLAELKSWGDLGTICDLELYKKDRVEVNKLLNGWIEIKPKLDELDDEDLE